MFKKFKIENRLKKIVYFDENSAVDLLQIYNKGNLEKIIELNKEISGGINASVNSEVGIGADKGSIISKFTGNEAYFDSKVNGKGKLNGRSVATTIIRNTLLSDFLSLANNGNINRNNSIVDIMSGYKLTIQPNSMTYFATIAPLTGLFSGNQKVKGEDLYMSMSKMNSVIRNSKGYFELKGSKTNFNDVIFRFNIESFRNNYRIQDLTKMNLNFYVVKVGQSKVNLNFNEEFNLPYNDNYADYIANKEKIDNEQYVDVYDVIIAGVK